jgi:hypothetical protein
MRSSTSFTFACALLACGKKTPPAPEIIATTTPPPPIASSAPMASTSATVAAIADASEDVAAAQDDGSAALGLEDTVDAGVAWVTEQSHGCLGWNATTRHAVCIAGSSETSKAPSMRATDPFDDAFSPINWLDPNQTGSQHDMEDPPPSAVSRVAKLAAALHLTPIDRKTSRKVAIGESLELTAPKKLTVRYKRTASGGSTTDTIELGCRSTPKALFSSTWSTSLALKDQNVDVFVDPTSAIALVEWSVVHGNLNFAGHDTFVLGIDFTKQDYCSLFGTSF